MKAHIIWRDMPVSRECQQCGTKFERKPSDITRSGAKYCSLKCYWESKKKRIGRVCIVCGKEFEVIPTRLHHKPSIYCSIECKATAAKKNVTSVCIYCGKVFPAKSYEKSKGKNVYCSQRCKRLHMVGEHHPCWKGGVSFEPYCPKFNVEFRQRVRAFFGNRCVLCGKHASELKRNLHVHHVNYDKLTCCNTSPKEFVPLCASCHSKTSKSRRDEWHTYFHNLIETRYNGKCYYSKEEFELIRTGS